jgi:hypothetical protein
MIPTPESNYQKYKCQVCGDEYSVTYKKEYVKDSNGFKFWGHGIG